MEAEIRSAARKHLPTPIRRPLGSLAGRFNYFVLQPLQGLLFDLSGGQFRADGCTFVIPKQLTTRTYRACFWKGDYEKEERELVRRWVRPEDSVLELGACLGIVSCVTNQLLADKSRHVVVEANPYCLETLYRNKELNHSGFLIEHCAVAGQSETTFYLHPIYIVGGTPLRPTGRPVRVPAKSLRQLASERGPFTTLIMDIEGGELGALADSREILKGLRLVIVELHNFAIGVEGVEKCRAILGESGLHRIDCAGITEAWQRG